MSGPSAEALAEVYASNGPSLAGDFIYFWLYGIATVMAWNYYEYCTDDTWILKCLVAWQMSMGALQFGTLFANAWWLAVQGWGDVRLFLFAVTVSGNLINWSTVAIVVPSQIFFASIAFRSLARNWYFAAFIGLGIGVVTAAGLATCIQLTFLGKTYNSAPLFPNMYLWSIVGVEVVTAGVLCWRFKSLQKGAGEESRNILTRFIFLSLRTSSMTTAIATMNRLESVAGEGLQGQATGNFLAGIVLISLLHTLNSRKSLYHRKNTSQEDHGTSQRGFGKFNRNGTGAGNMARSQLPITNSYDEEKMASNAAHPFTNTAPMRSLTFAQ